MSRLIYRAPLVSIRFVGTSGETILSPFVVNNQTSGVVDASIQLLSADVQLSNIKTVRVLQAVCAVDSITLLLDILSLLL
jgi:hypothetical protein